MACSFAAFNPPSSGERNNFVSCESPCYMRIDSCCDVPNNGDDDDGCDDGSDDGTDCGMDDVDGAQVYHGDVLQVVSDINKKVLAVNNEKLTATGNISRSKIFICGEEIYFHCHATGADGEGRNSFLLLPVKPRDGTVKPGSDKKVFECPVLSSLTDSVRALTVSVDGAAKSLAIEEIAHTAPEARSLWYLTPAAANECGYLWRVQAKLPNDEEVYVAADNEGQVYVTSKDDDLPMDDELHNPQTYFYLYRKSFIDELP